MDTLTKSYSSTIVITANGDVQTNEVTVVYVKELDIFLTLKVFQNTPAVLSLGKLCDETRVFLRNDECQRAHLIDNGIRIPCNTENFIPIVVPGFVKFIFWIVIALKDSIETGESFFFIFILTFFTYSRRNSGSRKGRCD